MASQPRQQREPKAGVYVPRHRREMLEKAKQEQQQKAQEQQQMEQEAKDKKLAPSPRVKEVTLNLKNLTLSDPSGSKVGKTLVFLTFWV